MLSAALPRYNTRYDAILVDEGQDFCDLWWLPVEELLAGKTTSSFYIFLDRRQNIFRREGNLPFFGPGYVLPSNCRNTAAIARLVHGLGGVLGGGPTWVPEGVEPVFTSTEDEAGERSSERMASDEPNLDWVEVLSTEEKAGEFLRGIDLALEEGRAERDRAAEERVAREQEERLAELSGLVARMEAHEPAADEAFPDAVRVALDSVAASDPRLLALVRPYEHLLTGRAFRRLRRAVRPKDAEEEEEPAVSEEEARLFLTLLRRWRVGD